MLSHEEIDRLARLARLALSPAESEDLRAQLNEILGMVDAMRAVDTTGVAPMSHPQEATQRLREDRVTEADRSETFLALAPATEDGLYLVPKVIE